MQTYFFLNNELNEDIIYTLGSFRLDDFIGSPLPSAQTSSKYDDLKSIADVYFKKVKRRYNVSDYIKQVQHIDHTLFKIIEQFVPAKSNLKTGLLIEPHYLERTKFERELPVRSDGQTMTEGLHQYFEAPIKGETVDEIYQFTGSLGGGNVVTTNNLSRETDDNGRRKEQGTNSTIDVYSIILSDPQEAAQAPIRPFVGSKPDGYIKRESNVLLGNATKGKKSKKYFSTPVSGSNITSPYFIN